MSSYPTYDMEAQKQPAAALVSAVAQDSPAWDAGFEPGCRVVAVDGNPVRDIIDWRWYTSEDTISLSYIDLQGDSGTITLERDPGQDWGFEFDGVVFDGVKLCRNACTFCFMRQLPENMRPSLSMRDDDFRLSFLAGTFVTMTNISEEDEARIVEQHISPLRVSLHAISSQVRQKLIGKHEAWGMQVISRLLEQGIEMHMQIVLVPRVNDGTELKRTLDWAYKHPGVLEVGIVPLGYTRHQDIFQHSFNTPYAARNVLQLIEPFQRKAIRDRGHAWVFAADEFYHNAYQQNMLEMLPSTRFYGDFDMFEDGIGIIRSFVDDWNTTVQEGVAFDLACALRQKNKHAVIVVGYAMLPFFEQLVAASPLALLLHVLPVENKFFGGNVDVTGLLTGYDIAQALLAYDKSASQKDASQNAGSRGAQNEFSLKESVVVVPKVVVNEHGVLLDDATLDDIRAWSGIAVTAVSCNPSGFLREIMQLLSADTHGVCDNTL